VAVVDAVPAAGDGCEPLRVAVCPDELEPGGGVSDGAAGLAGAAAVLLSLAVVCLEPAKRAASSEVDASA
jgi:hypothetical protein